MNRLRCKKGTTITEMLCVIVVVLLLSALLVTGIQLAVKAYTATVAASEAKVLCSTLTAAVKEELRFAGYTLGDTQVTFFSPNYGKDCYFVNQDGMVMLQTQKDIKPLVSSAAYTYGSTAEIQVSFQNEIFTVTLTVRDASGDQILAQNRFQVKRLGGSV